MPRGHRWEAMLPEEFNEELARAPIVYWACGAMEDHGLHNALGADPYVAYQTCLRAASLSGGIVFPPVPFAPAGIPGYSRQELRSGERELFLPSLWVSRELCQSLYTELLESLADLGFRACVTNGRHYPADLLLRELEERYQGRMGAMRFWGGGTLRLIEDEVARLVRDDPAADGHGAMWETAMVMGVCGAWVDLPRAARIMESPIPSQLKMTTPEMRARVAGATVELGERLLDLAARRSAEVATRLLDG